MRNNLFKKAILLPAAAVLILAAVTGCSEAATQPPLQEIGVPVHFETFRDIPGITPQEITEIEALINSRDSFTYGQMLETEVFILPDGTMAGFVVDFTDLLSELFGTGFILDLYTWDTLKEGIDNMSIDFTGEFIATPERTQQYIMSLPIAERSHRLYMLESNYMSILTLQDLKGRRIGCLDGSVESVHVMQYYPELDVDFIPAGNFDEAIDMLKNDEIDAFLAKAVQDPSFAQYGITHYRDLFPLVYTAVSLSTANPELAPIINAVNKYIAAGGIDTLQELYQAGNDLYTTFKLSNSFTEEEKDYLDYLKENNISVKAALQIGNYPICFYNETEKHFQGIVIDLLDEVSKYTGIVFEPANSGTAQWPEILEMLNNGEAQVISQLLYSPEREGDYLWPDRPTASSYYALISRYDYPTLAGYQVVRSKVGTVKDSAFENMYKEWFPNNNNLTLYNTQIEALKALENGDIDLMMGSDYLLLMQQNYYEKPGYKLNIRFPVPMDSYLGFHINETELRSIVSKSLDYIELDSIVDDWTSRGYDYVATMAQQRVFYSTILAVSMTLMLLLAVFFIIRLRKRDKELSRQKELAQAASLTKSAFLANMSHEMRTPLTSVIGITELTLRTADIDDETHENLIKVYRAGETLLGLINDILDISKIEANRFELHCARYDLPSMLNDTITQSLLYLGDKPVKFILSIPEDLPRTLHGDELRVKQILNNLLSNAFKFTDEGTVELKLRCQRDGDSVWMTASVTDTGIGIKEKDFSKLFTLYASMSQKNSTRDSSRRIEGSGLGLSICKRISEMMDGSISVKSEYGKGSVFTVKLRQSYVDDAVIGADMVSSLRNFHYSLNKFKDSDNKRRNLSYANVLVVDDNTANLDVAKGLMRLYGMRVDCVTDARQAIDAVMSEKIKYNAIFMDHMMPEIDGIEATRLIREIDTAYAKSIPIIALTANAVIGNEEMFLSKGFQSFLAKPIELTKLDDILSQWVRNKDEEAKLADKWLQIDRRTSDKLPSFHNCIPGLDARKGLKHFMREDVYSDVLRSFANNTKPLLDSIKDADYEKLNDYSIIVHGIKGSARGIFAEGIAGMAEALELSAKAGDTEYIAKNHGIFLDAARKLIFDIESALEKISEGRLPVRDYPGKDLLERFLTASRSFDIDEMDSVMAEIEKYSYSSDEGLSAWLRECLEKGQYKAITEKLSEILSG